ncbi:MAG: Gfo/Idh/MocA family oxidoreductase [Planctomycetales bacterium]|nr:Gfo/Idh/MocA family oxidoreductase [Planctomycetales bacterium]
MRELKFAMIGAGFWSQYQLAAWGEVSGARCIAICDPVLEKAHKLAKACAVPHVFQDLRELLDQHELDFVDIVTSVETHTSLAMTAMRRGVAVICQKPLADSLEAARGLCRQARELAVPLLVHENFRWQQPIRRLKAVIDSGELGELVRARIDFAHSFPIFDNQPALKLLDKLILADVGTHILDVSRFLFGEAQKLCCQTRQMQQGICGEDVATVLLNNQNGLTVACNMSYTSQWELNRFPQTMVAVEGTRRGVSLGRDYQLLRFSDGETKCEQIVVDEYPWANPEYMVVHSSMVGCHRNLLAGLRGETTAETTGDDNLRTLELVHACYDSAANGRVVQLNSNYS